MFDLSINLFNVKFMEFIFNERNKECQLLLFTSWVYKHMSSNGRSGLFVGLNKGHIMTAPATQAWKTRPVLRKGLTSRRCQFVREIINEVAGQSVLQKRMKELILTGNSTKEKRAQKIAK